MHLGVIANFAKQHAGEVLLRVARLAADRGISLHADASTVAAMGAAALSLPEGRRALRTQGGWLAPVLALLVVLPHAQWLLAHLPQATEGTVQRMDISAQPRWGRGLRELPVRKRLHVAVDRGRRRQAIGRQAVC